MVSTVYLSLQCFWETHKNVYSMQILDMPKLYLKQAEDNLLFKKYKRDWWTNIGVPYVPFNGFGSFSSYIE